MASPELAELLEEMFAARDLDYSSLHDMRALMAEPADRARDCC